MKNLPQLACKFDLDQCERKSTEVHARPGQTFSQEVFKLRVLASPFAQCLKCGAHRSISPLNDITALTVMIQARSFEFEITRMISDLIIHMKKLLDSDWLRTVQFKCNTSANYTS